MFHTEMSKDGRILQAKTAVPRGHIKHSFPRAGAAANRKRNAKDHPRSRPGVMQQVKSNQKAIALTSAVGGWPHTAPATSNISTMASCPSSLAQSMGVSPARGLNVS